MWLHKAVTVATTECNSSAFLQNSPNRRLQFFLLSSSVHTLFACHIDLPHKLIPQVLAHFLSSSVLGMDGLSVASSVLAIGAVGVQISIKLTAFANQVSTADDRIRSIGSDVSLTANVLQQLSELMSKSNENTAISIFSEEGLSSTSASADACERVFRELEDVLKRASNQLQGRGCQVLGKKIELSKYETLRWPFLQPNIDSLRAALRDAKETLMLILHVTTLAYMKKLAEL